MADFGKYKFPTRRSGKTEAGNALMDAMKMTFGYFIADAASRKEYEEPVLFIIEELHFKPTRETLEDVDGNLYLEFARDDESLTLVSDEEDGDVDIISNVELPISSLHEWMEP